MEIIFASAEPISLNNVITANLLVLLTNIFSVIFGSIGSNVMFGANRAHNKIKLTNETFTRSYLGYLTFYFYLVSRYVYSEKPIESGVFGLIVFCIIGSLALMMLSAFVTKNIMERIQRNHRCNFNPEYCEIGTRQLAIEHEGRRLQCKFLSQPTTYYCTVTVSKGEALRFVWLNLLFGAIGLTAAVLTALNVSR